MPSDCKIVHFRTSEEIATDESHCYISDSMQRDFGIDLAIGKFLDNKFKCYLTIDVKYVRNIYLESYCEGKFSRRDRSFTAYRFHINSPIDPNEIKDVMPGLAEGEISKLTNNHALAYMFVSKNTNAVIGDKPIILIEDIIGALNRGYLTEYKTCVPRHIKNRPIEHSKITAGNRIDLVFEEKPFFSGIEKYKASKQDNISYIQTGDFNILECPGVAECTAIQYDNEVIFEVSKGKARYFIATEDFGNWIDINEVNTKDNTFSIPPEKIKQLILQEQKESLKHHKIEP